jgi:molybdenum cofactor cytidylyltransferase
MKISGIILAAGESRRMGTLKQLLPYRDKTVIETVVDSFQQVDLHEIIVVLGYCAKQIQKTLNGYSIKTVINEKYCDGMLSSIQCGIESVDAFADAFLIGLGDQPFVPTSVISELLKHFISQEKGIILPSYGGKRGHPIIIHRKYRDDIFGLDHNIGLKQLIHHNQNDLLVVDVASDVVIRDMDFPEDYERELRVLKI